MSSWKVLYFIGIVLQFFHFGMISEGNCATILLEFFIYMETRTLIDGLVSIN